MSRRLNLATNAVLVLFLLGSLYIVFGADDANRHSLSDFRPFAGVVCGIGAGIAIQRVLNRMRR